MNTLEEVKKLAKELFEKNNIGDWEFDFDRATSRFGCCYTYRKRITLSQKITELNLGSNSHHIRNTLLHEIAHALAGAHHNHDNHWRSIAKSIGCTGTRCYSTSVVTPPEKYKGTCPICMTEIKKNRKSKGACIKCCNKYNNGKYSKRFMFRWELNNEERSTNESL
jgi:hypothetical protein